MSLRVILKSAADRFVAVMDRVVAGLPAFLGVIFTHLAEIKEVLQIVAILVGIGSTCLLTWWKRPKAKGAKEDEQT